MPHNLPPDDQALIDEAYALAQRINVIAADLQRRQIMIEIGTHDTSQIGQPNTQRLAIGFRQILSPTRSERVRS